MRAREKERQRERERVIIISHHIGEHIHACIHTGLSHSQKFLADVALEFFGSPRDAAASVCASVCGCGCGCGCECGCGCVRAALCVCG